MPYVTPASKPQVQNKDNSSTLIRPASPTEFEDDEEELEVPHGDIGVGSGVETEETSPVAEGDDPGQGQEDEDDARVEDDVSSEDDANSEYDGELELEQEQEDSEMDDDLLFGGPLSQSGLTKPSEAQPGSRKDETTSKEMAEQNAMSEEDRAAYTKAIEEAENDDELGCQLKALLRHKKETGLLKLNTDWTIQLDDILCLYFLEDRTNGAWFTITIIMTLLQLEARHVQDVHVECNLDIFILLADSDEWMEGQIEIARNCGELEYGWPFADMTEARPYIITVLNTGAHWVTVEVQLGGNGEPTTIYTYNSVHTGDGKGRTRRITAVLLPKLLYLASLRPGSPLAGFDPDQCVIEREECPQQAGSWDCGAFSIYFAVRRLYNQGVVPSGPLETWAHRSDFGNWLRRACATALYNNWRQAGNGTLLKDLFADPFAGPEELPDEVTAHLAAFARQAAARDVEAATATDEAAARAAEAAAEARELDAVAAEAMGLSTGSGPASGTFEHSTPWHPVVRFEIGESNHAVRTVIIVMRWSAYAHWWFQQRKADPTVTEDDFASELRLRVQYWLDVYLEATGHDAGHLRCIVYGGTRILTRFIPSIAMEDSRHRFVDDQQDNIEKENDAKDVTLQCPICEWSVKRTNMDVGLKVFMDPYWRHLTKHMPPPTIEREGELLTATCVWPGCGKQSKSKAKNRLLAFHPAAEHGKEWLEGYDKELSFACNCSDQDCERIYTDEAKLKKHLKSTVSCPHCDRKFEIAQNRNTHLKRIHWNQTPAPGWVQCNAETFDHTLMQKTWIELPEIFRHRLAASSNLSCVWGCRSKGLKTSIAVQKHYDAKHQHGIWPRQTTPEIHRCSVQFPTQAELERHSKCHVERTPEDKTAYDSEWSKQKDINRAKEWSRNIATDLKHYARESASKPVLLSVGLDGFTCNTTLLPAWLQEVDVDFTLAIATDTIPADTLNVQDFSKIDRSYLALYESDVLLSSLLDRSTAPTRYTDLFTLWDLQQDIKDAQSRIRASRNHAH
jgi:hypothetical protein